jgi:outer membrane immunogenic protein
MKNVMFAAAALAAVSSPAMAKDAFTGPRVEVTAGYNDVTNVPANRGFAYGVDAGYDVKLVGPVTAGLEVGLDNVLDRRDVNVGGRLGVALNDHTQAFADVGYDNFRDLSAHNLEGVRFGAGLQVNVIGPVYTLVEYHRTDLGTTKKNAVAAGVGVRF